MSLTFIVPITFPWYQIKSCFFLVVSSSTVVVPSLTPSCVDMVWRCTYSSTWNSVREIRKEWEGGGWGCDKEGVRGCESVSDGVWVDVCVRVFIRECVRGCVRWYVRRCVRGCVKGCIITRSFNYHILHLRIRRYWISTHSQSLFGRS